MSEFLFGHNASENHVDQAACRLDTEKKFHAPSSGRPTVSLQLAPPPLHMNGADGGVCRPLDQGRSDVGVMSVAGEGEISYPWVEISQDLVHSDTVRSDTVCSDTVRNRIGEAGASPDRCHYVNAASCPDCGSGMVRLGSCFSCPACGWGSCC
ncbi:MAG: hypothetical protein KOO62_07135 [candidate division Zixibacteria bacterium]|nr:hypothetical protein [candidate division Zixibacteria bacterium]